MKNINFFALLFVMKLIFFKKIMFQRRAPCDSIQRLVLKFKFAKNEYIFIIILLNVIKCNVLAIVSDSTQAMASIRKCDKEMRRAFLGNVYMAGGATRIAVIKSY